MQIAFIKLTPHENSENDEIWVEAMSIKHIGVADGITFVETSAGCSYVTETVDEVLEKVGEVAEYFD